MALFKRFFFRKPPDGLLEISERVYVFDYCFSTDVVGEDEYKEYVETIVMQCRSHFPDGSFMVFNFREGETESQIASILSESDMTVMDYPRHYEGCPLLKMEMVHHFLRSCESWLCLGQQNLLLMHCERGGWPVLAFMLAALLIYLKQYTGEQRTLDMVYKQAPHELLQFLSPLNPVPSQLRYLQYVSRSVASEWPPLDRALTLDCIILRMIPIFDSEGGCRPIFRIYGQDPLLLSEKRTKILFSTPKKSKLVRHYKQAECELVKIDIGCHIQGDVVIECISLDKDMEREEMMFTVVLNTAFIRSNILMLNRDQIDILWGAKDRFSKDFRAEVLLSDMDVASSLTITELTDIEEKGLPVEAFSKVHEIFSHLDWLEGKEDAALQILRQMVSPNSEEKSDKVTREKVESHSQPQSSNTKSLSEKLQSNDKNKDDVSESETARAKMTFPLSQHSVSVFGQSESSETSMSQPPSSEPVEKFMHSALLQPPSSIPPAPPLPLPLPPPLELPFYALSKKLTIPPAPPSIQCLHAIKNVSLALSPIPLPSQPPSKSEPHRKSPIPSSAISKSLLLLSLQSQELLATKSGTSIDVSLPSPISNLSPNIYDNLNNLSENHLQPLGDPLNKYSSTLPHPHSAILSSPALLLPSRLDISSPPPLPPPYSIIPSTPPRVNPSPPLRVIPSPPPPCFVVSSPPPQIPTPPPPPYIAISSPQLDVLPLSPPPPHLVITSPPPQLFIPTSPPPPPCLAVSSPPQLVVLSPLPCSTIPSPPPSAMPSPPQQTTIALASHPPSTTHPPSPMKKTKMTIIMPPPPPPLPCLKSKQSDESFSLSSQPFSHAPPATSSSCIMVASQSNNTQFVPPPPKSFSSSLTSLSLGTKKTLTRVKSTKSVYSAQSSSRKASLKPLHWVKVTRVMSGSLWAETQKSDELSKILEIDMSELESLFPAAVPNSKHQASFGGKSDKTHLIGLRRANNCEIMLTKVKVPIHDLMTLMLALDESTLDVDQVDNLIKFCPTKEEMELLQGYKGDKESLGKCEQFFLELMKVPRVESKLRVFYFKIQFRSQVADLRINLNTINSVAEEIRGSVKLKRIMQAILSLGNALNQGTARGSAIGFRLDSLLKLCDFRARNNKMTLMHYLCKVLAEKLPEVLDFHKNLVFLEAASKLEFKILAEEMQAINKGVKNVEQELISSDRDGPPVSETFCENLKRFLIVAEAEVRSLTSLYTLVNRNADALIQYFGEDPARCSFEQVVSTLFNFARMFERAHEENSKQQELERKRAQREAEQEKMKLTMHKKDKKISNSK